VLTATLLIGHATLYEFSSRQHIFNWTRSEQLRPQPGLLEDIRCCLATSLSVAVHKTDEVKQYLLNIWLGMDHHIMHMQLTRGVGILEHVCMQMWSLEQLL